MAKNNPPSDTLRVRKSIPTGSYMDEDEFEDLFKRKGKNPKNYPQLSVQDYSKVKEDEEGNKYIHKLSPDSNSNMLYNAPKMKHPSMMRMEKMASKVAGTPMYPSNKSKHPQSAARMSVTDEGIKGLQKNHGGKNI